MLARPSLRPHAYTCAAATRGRHAANPLPAPTQNRLLAALPAAEYERLLRDLEPVDLPPGCTIHSAGDRRKYLYFVTSGIVCRSSVTRNGASAGFAVAGSEGVIGVAAFLGGDSMPSQAVVLSAGNAYRLPAYVLTAEFEHDDTLPRVLLQYTLALFTQIGQIAVCNRHHSLEQQVCRWILSCLDRLPSSELVMTHERIAEMLGVRREGVTEAAGTLQKAGLIRCSRGHIAVIDRARLEAKACECYSVVKREYERLLFDPRQVEWARIATPASRFQPLHHAMDARQ